MNSFGKNINTVKKQESSFYINISIWCWTLLMSIDYENPWIYRDRQFSSDDIGEFYGFVYNITNLTNQRQYIGRKYFYQHRTPKGKKRKVKSESNWKKYYGSCPELKEDIELLGRQNFSRTILNLYIKQRQNKL